MEPGEWQITLPNGEKIKTCKSRRWIRIGRCSTMLSFGLLMMLFWFSSYGSLLMLFLWCHSYDTVLMMLFLWYASHDTFLLIFLCWPSYVDLLQCPPTMPSYDSLPTMLLWSSSYSGMLFWRQCHWFSGCYANRGRTQIGIGNWRWFLVAFSTRVLYRRWLSRMQMNNVNNVCTRLLIFEDFSLFSKFNFFFPFYSHRCYWDHNGSSPRSNDAQWSSSGVQGL